MKNPPAIDTLFEHALVINRDDEPGRLVQLRRAFEREGLPMPRRVGAIALLGLKNNQKWRCSGNRYYAANCAASHIMCVRLAETMGWPFVMVFEDDAWPCRNARAAIAAALSAAPEGCGVLRFGCARNRLGFRSGTQAQIFFAPAYKTYFAAYRADIEIYNADCVFQEWAPLAKLTAYAEGVFTQCDMAGARYLHFDGEPCLRPDPPKGFPRWEEVMA